MPHLAAILQTISGVTLRRSIESPHYHLWTDAVHARQLARDAGNEWDRGTYVRWTITSAWTAFETTCETLLATTGIGNRFKENLNDALHQRRLNHPDWGQGLWQRVLHIYGLRKDYIHGGIPQERLLAPVVEAENAITVIREAVKDMYVRVGEAVPLWPDDDQDPADPRKGFANLTLIRAGSDSPDAVRITFMMLDEEFTYEVCPPGTGPPATHGRAAADDYGAGHSRARVPWAGVDRRAHHSDARSTHLIRTSLYDP